MNKKYLLVLIWMLILSIVKIVAQTLNEICEIGLPVVIINTVNNEVPSCEFAEPPYKVDCVSTTNATKVPCSITIRMHDKILYESGEYVENISGATIKIRGNTSATEKQKPYKIKLQKKADLLLRNDSAYKDKEWLLMKENKLKSFIGFTFNTLLDMPYKPELKPVNVVMNNEYYGLYYITESVKRNNKCRINVDKETGYIFEYDAYWWNEDYYIPVEFGDPYMKFTLKYPDTKDATDDQKYYLESWLEELQQAVMNGNGSDFLYLDTCARWILAQDLFGNSDGAGSNLYFAKSDNSTNTKAYTPTLWDFDGFFFIKDKWSQPHDWKESFFHSLFVYDKHHTFTTAYCKEWQSIVQNNLIESLIQAINKYANSEEGSAVEKSYNLTTLKYYGHDFQWSITEQAKTYEIWIKERKSWLDNEINEICNSCLIKKVDVNNIIYDVLGRRCPSSYKGVKIINGEKVILRGIK
ncbi:MAG: hypothetical protein E7077_04910 [Bacteroidales bacterium]|jgi:hypothetical protein|nr:hypothetical protein [Bacteroidales bacterium]